MTDRRIANSGSFYRHFFYTRRGITHKSKTKTRRSYRIINVPMTSCSPAGSAPGLLLAQQANEPIIGPD